MQTIFFVFSVGGILTVLALLGALFGIGLLQYLVAFFNAMFEPPTTTGIREPKPRLPKGKRQSWKERWEYSKISEAEHLRLRAERDEVVRQMMEHGDI